VIALLTMLACTPSQPEVQAPAVTVEEPAAITAKRQTQRKLYTVDVRFIPDRPEVGQLFQVEAILLDKAGEPIEDAVVRMNARMPHHNHGMMTDPKDQPGECPEDGRCVHEGGKYLTDGFKFHMPGDWTVTIEVEGPNGFDNTSFVVPF